MDLQYKELSKKIEKLTRILTDGTALTQSERTAKENERAALVQQLVSLQNILKLVGITKIIHKH